VKIVIDHVRGSRRGQRQVFVGAERVTIGRHPRSEVTFDAHRDIDSSSRHAEVRRRDAGYVLSDVGSSNGTFVAGARIDEVALTPESALEVEFGPGGPVLRIWVGPEDGTAEPRPGGRRRGVRLLLVLVVVAMLGAVLYRFLG
jgi:hypothetical protein